MEIAARETDTVTALIVNEPPLKTEMPETQQRDSTSKGSSKRKMSGGLANQHPDNRAYKKEKELIQPRSFEASRNW